MFVISHSEQPLLRCLIHNLFIVRPGRIHVDDMAVWFLLMQLLFLRTAVSTTDTPTLMAMMMMIEGGDNDRGDAGDAVL
jgi:hypothetical protein